MWPTNLWAPSSRPAAPASPSTISQGARTPTPPPFPHSASASAPSRAGVSSPAFSLDLGFVVSARDLPIEDSSWFNFLFSFGPGLQFFTSPNVSLRVEYLYRHASNAGLGDQNPGVDQGVTRLTLSRRW